MRCLIIGGTGMLGHQLLNSWQSHHDVRVTLRQERHRYEQFELFTPENSFDNIDVRDIDGVSKLLSEFQPDSVVNAAGIIKQRSTSNDALTSLEINAVFPHRLQRICRDRNIRMVHISTDCVFNGTGLFNGKEEGHEKEDVATEQTASNAEDFYGRSKFLGEVTDAPCLTLRSSIIGLELTQKASLVEWFLAQQGRIKGFANALYTGVTTAEMARIIENVCTEQRNLHGLWQVASEPINKYDLLTILAEKMNRNDITIEPDTEFHCDRRLNGSAFAQKTGYAVASWDDMLTELAEQIAARKNRRVQTAA